MIRPMLKACTPCGRPQPAMTSSTESGATSGLRSSSWSITHAPVSSGRSPASEPLKARPTGVRMASTMTASGMRVLQVGGLLRRHAEGAVEADRLSVEHRVLGDLAGELGELGGPAQAGRERHALPELDAGGLRQRREQRRVEEPGGDRADADA